MEGEDFLYRLFKPRSVAVIGASRNPAKVGHSVLKNIIESGFKGRVYPVNPTATEVLGLKAYSSVLDVPEPVDLVVVAIPAEKAVDAVRESGEKGVKFAIVISAGFRETGGEGATREAMLVKVAREHGVRLLGPNCLGLIDTYTPLNAAFTAKKPLKGKLALVSQSGALITAILDWSLKAGIGFSKVVSLGNKADLDEVDFLKALAHDDSTRVILLYVEEINRGRDFVSAAQRASKIKPIVVLKGGVTEAGARAAASHTGAIAGSFRVYEAAFRKAGVIYVETVEELFDHALALSMQGLPSGNGVAIVTNAGGPGILATDYSALRGLKLARLSSATVQRLRELLPPEASTHNPIDVLGDARAERYEGALRALLEDPSVGSVIVILTPQAMTEPVETARAIIQLNAIYPTKPIVAVFMGGESVEEASKLLLRHDIPCFDLPERGVNATLALYKYAQLREAIEALSKERPVIYPVSREQALRVIERALSENRVVLLEHEALEVMRSYGISVPKTILTTGESEAVEAAEKMGFPVVVKISSPQILHKTDVGGVVVGLNSPSEVREAYREVLSRARKHAPSARILGVIVQEMVPKGREVIVGAIRDARFGHMIMFGAGGVYAELLRDTSFRLTPLVPSEIKSMIGETKVFELLKGYRGEPPHDLECVEDVVSKVNQLVTENDIIVEMDINPLYVYEKGKGCIALDVKVVLEPSRG